MAGYHSDVTEGRGRETDRRIYPHNDVQDKINSQIGLQIGVMLIFGILTIQV